uniref:Leucine-rich repeats and immunoglobulin-like domains 3 n=1 Tax=Cyprinodon variegatus TaxID=28743 RepID=A0A3Q2E6N5_CYPVA
ANNRIGGISEEQLRSFSSLQTLDFSNNKIVEIKMDSFPALPLRNFLCNNRISSLELGWAANLAGTLQVLELSHNRISSIPARLFQLPNLQHDLSRNQIRRVEGLTFQDLPTLRSLKLQRNRLSGLMDGAFFGLSNMEVQLGFNNLTEVSKGWLYGLEALQQLHLEHNAISRIQPDTWRCCQKLSKDLSSNHLSRLEESSFDGLSLLDQLHVGNNRVSFIAGGAFRGLPNLQMDLQNNEISWTIEDMNGPFSALEKMKTFLQGNQIRSVTKKSFSGLDELDLSNNGIMSIQANAFSQMKNLQQLPKPKITVQPETQSALKGTNVTFVCSAASSSDSPMNFSWKKDNEVLNDAEIHNQAHLRAQGDAGSETEVTEYTTTLQLRNVDFSAEGRYQCVISNQFGSSYSTKARLTVNLPSFLKTPMDLTVRAGMMARLECAATGHPSPQIAWQKDGGTDFPAARERRMHVMPEDDVFFIVGVKTEDIGVYSCTAQNTAGAISANATLTVLDSPLLVTERHFFAAANQLLIVVDAAEADAGKYTCEMSNVLGTERGDVRLAVLPNPNCDSAAQGGVGLVMGGGLGAADDGWATVGVVIIAVVCCVVGTSLVWVVIIYHTRRRNEDCSVTNT